MVIIDEVINVDLNMALEITGEPSKTVYFDIETTGFSPLNTQLYLIGAVYFKDNQYHICQWFAESISDEKEILIDFLDFLSNYNMLVHYNGSGFDLPYIIKKCQLLHIDYDFSNLNSIDIYKLLLPVKNALKIENLKQKSLETFLGIEREDVYNGGELIQVYHKYLTNKDEASKSLLLLHNHDDVIGMLQILPALHYTGLTSEAYHLVSMQLKDGQNIHGMPIKELYIEMALDYFLPKRISFGNDLYYCTAGGNVARICIQVYTNELKFFYPNYKDYYYLPMEDRSIHKSVAFYVDKDFRTKAKAANCYSKKTGTFLPQFEEVIQPYFKVDYYDKISYFEFTEEFQNNTDQIMQYIKHIFKILIR